MSVLVAHAPEVPLETLVPALRQAAKRVDPRVPVVDAKAMEHHLYSSMYLFRMGAGIGSVLGLLALALSAAGLYGVMAYSVGQRRYELGIRVALGAGAGRVVSLVMRRGLRLALLGSAIGLVLGLALSTVLSSVVFGIAAQDWVTFGAVALMIAVVAALATFFPALSASRTDPARVLKTEG